MQKEDFLYVDLNDEIKIIGYVGDCETVVIPENIDGKPVTEIGARDRECIKNVHTMTISKNVRHINPDALIFGTSKHWINGLSVGEDHPYFLLEDDVLYTKDKKEILFNFDDSIVECVMPDEVEEVADHAFEGASELSKLTLSPNLKKIGNHAFHHNKLKKLTIPPYVEEIGEEAFQAWDMELTLEGNTKLGVNVATSFLLGPDVSAYIVENGLFMNSEKTRLLKYVGDGYDTSIEIPDTIETIDSEAFNLANKLTKIKLNKGLKYIGEYAFFYTSLKTVKIPASVEYFAQNAFSKQRPKTKVTFEKGNPWYRQDEVALYRKIGENEEEIAAILDTSITSFTVPPTVKRLVDPVFHNCPNLTELNLPEGLLEFNEKCMQQTGLNDECKVKKVHLPSSVQKFEIIGRQYDGSGLTEYEIDKNNKHYFVEDDLVYRVNGDYDYTLMFAQNPKRKKAEILEGTTRIESYAFSPAYAPKFENLTQITIPETVVEIGECAFADKGVNEEYSVSEVQQEIEQFDDEISETVEIFSFEKINENEEKSVFDNSWIDSPEIEKVSVPEKHENRCVTELDINSNFISKAVKELFIPSHVKKIEYCGYNFAEGLEKLDVSPENPVFSTDGTALLNKDGTILYRMFCFQKKEYRVPAGVKIIDAKAFGACRELVKVILPDSIEEIREEAFAGCEKLETIEGTEAVKNVGNHAFAGTAFSINQNIVILGSTLVKYKETGVASFRVPDGIETIAAEAFCVHDKEDQLKEVFLPSSLKTIEKNAFAGRTSLEKMIIPSKVKNISNEAFPVYRPAVHNLWRKDDPEEVTAFAGVDVVEENPYFSSVDGVLYSKDKSILYYVPDNYEKTVFEIGEETKTIKANAFFNNRKIKKVIIKKEVFIEPRAFFNLQALECLELSEEQKIISEESFVNCEKLTEIKFPSGLKIIEKGAFYKCGLNKIILPETLEEIGDQAFEHNQISEVKIPKSVTKIGKNIFGGNLKKITIYNNIESRGEPVEIKFFARREPTYIDSAIGLLGTPSMVYGSRNEDDTYFGPFIITVKSAETEQELIKVLMPGKSTKTERGNLEFAKLWNNNAEFNFRPIDAGFSELKCVDKLKYAEIRLQYSDTLDTSIKETLIKYLSRNAKEFIKKCIDLESVAYLESYEKFDIIKKTNIDEMIEYANKQKKKMFIKHLEKYKETHFKASNKKKASTSSKPAEKKAKQKSDGKIDKTSDAYMKKVWMIRDCGNGTGWITRYKGEDVDVVFPEYVCGIKIRGIDNRTGAVPKNYLSIKSIYLPNGYERIGNMAFAGCSSLKSINIPDTVEVIGAKAFMECSSLKSVVLPSKLESITEWTGKWMFRDCTNLEDVYVLNKEWSITGSAAFRGCSKLKIHAQEGAAIESAVKKNQFKILTEEEKDKIWFLLSQP